mmetsp:Transcript_14287/g.34026  ORF Transcript_14287/g.34026 Transcript_14287/m.34026 type:complete len:213 (+) Transcript_14287:2779-3417(+)
MSNKPTLMIWCLGPLCPSPLQEARAASTLRVCSSTWYLEPFTSPPATRRDGPPSDMLPGPLSMSIGGPCVASRCVALRLARHWLPGACFGSANTTTAGGLLASAPPACVPSLKPCPLAPLSLTASRSPATDRSTLVGICVRHMWHTSASSCSKSPRHERIFSNTVGLRLMVSVAMAVQTHCSMAMLGGGLRPICTMSSSKRNRHGLNNSSCT